MKAKLFVAAGLGLVVGAMSFAPPVCAEVPAAPAAGAAVKTDYAPAVKVTRLLKSTTDSAGRPLAYPKPEDGQAEVTALLVEIAPGGETGWHKHPLTCLAYLMEGEIEVTLANGAVHVVKAGDPLCEVVELAHNGINRGRVPAKLVFFVLGTTESGPFTVKVPAPEAAAATAKEPVK